MSGLAVLTTVVGVLAYMAARPEGRLFALACGVLVASCVPLLVFA